MARKKFLRGKWRTYSKLGRGRKKLQKYRRATGRHNKVREHCRGNPVKVDVGYKKQKKTSQIKMINNLNELIALNSGDIAIMGRVGQKKKLQMMEKAKEKNVKIVNINLKNLMKKIEKRKKEKKAEKDKRVEKEKAKKKEDTKKKEEKTEEKKENKAEKAEEIKKENLEENLENKK
jgi:ribosomal protein L32E